MKKLLLILFLSILVLVPLRVSAMMERGEEYKEEDQQRETIEYTKKTETEALIEECGRVGNPKVTPRGAIKTTLSEEPNTQEEIPNVEASQQLEGEDLLNLEVLEQRIEEAQETISFLSEKKTLLREEEFHDFYQKWNNLYECYNETSLSALGQKNVDDTTQQKLRELVEISSEIVARLQESRDNVAPSNMTRIATVPAVRSMQIEKDRAEKSVKKILSPERIAQKQAYQPPLTTMEGGYLFPNKGGGSFNGRWYTEHALERMAPPTPEIIELLYTRSVERAKKENIDLKEAKFDEADPLKILKRQPISLRAWWYNCGPDPRAILPSLVEAEIAHPGSTGLTVITAPEGTVITAMSNEREKRFAKSAALPRTSLTSTLRSHLASRPLFHEPSWLPYEESDKMPNLKKIQSLSKISRFLHRSKKSFPLETQKERMTKLLKNIQALQRKSDRDFKMKKFEEPFLWQWNQGDEVKKMRQQEVQQTIRNAVSYERLETALQGMKNRTLTISRTILKKPLPLRPCVTLQKKKKPKSLAKATPLPLPFQLNKEEPSIIASKEAKAQKNSKKEKRSEKEKRAAKKKNKNLF